MPIRPTPWLDEDASRDFRARIDKEAGVKATVPATPDIDKVIARIVSDANDGKKQG